MNITKEKIGAIALLALLAGCAISPDYHPPKEAETKSITWQQPLEAGLKATKTDLSQWWKRLGDEILNQLVSQALQDNLDLEIGRSRLRETRAQRQITGAARLPSVGVNASVQRQESGSLYRTGFDASWELDLFGRVQRAIEASDAEVEARLERLRDIQVSLLAELALNYLDVRSFQNRLRLAKANVAVQEKTYQIITKRLELGLATVLDVRAAEATLANNKSQLPALETGLRQAIHRVTFLIGKKPGHLDQLLTPPAIIPLAPLDNPIGIPADLLRRRPDIRAAERDLAAQHAKIGIAMTDHYPRFTLTGALAFQATEPTLLFTRLSRALSIGPAVQWRIFDGGKIENNILVQDERYQQVLLQYEKSVLTALEEVENGLVAYARVLDRRDHLNTAVSASQESLRIATAMYQDGLTDFSRVLDAQRALFSQEDQLADSHAEITRNLIRLYKALGGGWKNGQPLLGQGEP